MTFWATGTLSSPKIDIFIGSTIGSYYQNRYNDDCINAEGVAVLLTILTMLSTPILTAIFGDGSLEVRSYCPKPQKKIFKTIFNQGEDTEDWANDDPVEMEVEAANTNCKSELFPQETGQIVNSSESREVRKFGEALLRMRNKF